MDCEEALRDLALALQDRDAKKDLLGVLRAWSGLVLGTVTPDTRYGVGAGTNYRQQWILAEVKQAGRITTKAVAHHFWICPETARLDLSELVRCGMLAKTGDKRGCFYTPAQEGEAAG